MTAGPPYTASVHIRAQPEQVFEYFTEPEAILRWMGDYAALDPVPGGQFILDVNGVPVRGRYLAVDRPHRLVLSWGHAGSDRLPPGGSTVEVTFTPDAGGTVVTVVHSGLPAAEASQHRLGWGHFLARLVIAGGGGNPGPDPWAAQPPAPPIRSSGSPRRRGPSMRAPTASGSAKAHHPSGAVRAQPARTDHDPCGHQPQTPAMAAARCRCSTSPSP